MYSTIMATIKYICIKKEDNGRFNVYDGLYYVEILSCYCWLTFKTVGIMTLRIVRKSLF